MSITDWFALSAFFVNIIVVGVGWWSLSNRQAKNQGLRNGSVTQQLEDMGQRMNSADETSAQYRNSPHPMLPECLELFTSIKHDLGLVGGKIDTLIQLNKERHVA